MEPLEIRGSVDPGQCLHRQRWRFYLWHSQTENHRKMA